MKNWVISENKEIVYKVGEFLIQITTIEHMLERIYSEFVGGIENKEKFSEMMLGNKIAELSKRIKLGGEEKTKTIKDWANDKRSVNLRTRLFIMKEFRNKIAHNALEYNPVDKLVYIEADEITSDLEHHILHVDDLLGDLHIVLINLKEPKMVNWKKVIRNHLISL